MTTTSLLPPPSGISKLPTGLHCTGKAKCANLHRARFMCPVHTIETFGVREFKIITLLIWTHALPSLYSIASPKLTYNSENWDSDYPLSPLAWCEKTWIWYYIIVLYNIQKVPTLVCFIIVELVLHNSRNNTSVIVFRIWFDFYFTIILLFVLKYKYTKSLYISRAVRYLY